MDNFIIYVFLGILAGAFFPIQATINAKLRTYTQSPLMASFIAFSVGSLLLLTSLIVFDANFYQNIDFSYPIQIYIGGACAGVIFNVANIVLYAKIGATTSSFVTITGQIITGVVLDHFGLFNLPVHEVSLPRIIGIVLMIIAIVIYQKGTPQSIPVVHKKHDPKVMWWLLFGTFIGIFPPLQATFNGQLKLATQSVLASTFLSFFIGAIVLGILILIVAKYTRNPIYKLPMRTIPLWVYSGGIFGVVIVGSTIIVIHHLGSVLTSLVFILGQFMIAVLFDHFGLLGLAKRPITIQKMVALTIMGIALFIV